MVAVAQFSDRGTTIVRSLQSVLHALDEHKSPAERAAIYESLAAHIRSAAPMSLLGVADTLEPLREITIPGADGARVEVKAIDNGDQLDFYVQDATGHDADVVLSPAAASQLRDGIARVMASRGR